MMEDEVKMIQRTGTCRYCHQQRFVEVPEDADEEEINDTATEECDCEEALQAKERQQKIEAAQTWAGNVFTPGPQLDTVLSDIRAVAERKVESVTIKILKRTWTIDKDTNGMIRIRMTYKDTNEETF